MAKDQDTLIEQSPRVEMCSRIPLALVNTMMSRFLSLVHSFTAKPVLKNGLIFDIVFTLPHCIHCILPYNQECVNIIILLCDSCKSGTIIDSIHQSLTTVLYARHSYYGIITVTMVTLLHQQIQYQTQ